MFGAGRGPIFTEGNIADVMDGIFDRPMTAAKGLDLRGVHFGGRAAAEDNFGLFGNAKRLEMVSGADYHSSLDGVREARAFRSDLEGIDLTGFMPSVSLAQGDVRREKKRRSRPWKAWRVYRRAWVEDAW